MIPFLAVRSSFVDSELAGAAGFADTINAGPGIKQRIAAAKIVLEKTDNADRVLRLGDRRDVPDLLAAATCNEPRQRDATAGQAAGRQEGLIRRDQ